MLPWLRMYWPFLVVFIVGSVVRIYMFGSIPPGLNQDEASTAYDAFSLLMYGVDRNGYNNPLMLVSWGSGMYALPMYLMMAVFALFGISVQALRSVNLVFGLLSLLLFFRIVQKTGDRLLAILALLLLSISPWHIMLSRWGLDSNLFPALFLLAVWSLSGAKRNERNIVFAAIFFALTLYAYGTAYFVVPVFLLLCALYFWMTGWRLSRRTLCVSVTLFVIISIPIFLYILINTLHWPSIITPFFSIPRLTGPPRFATISLLFSKNTMADVFWNAKTLLRLLASGNDGHIWNSVPGYGYLYQFGGLFSLLGVVYILFFAPEKRRNPVYAFMLLWLIAALLLGLFESVNINRINILFLPVVFFAAVGIRSLATSRTALMGALLYFFVSFISFMTVYFGSYRERASGAFFASFGEAVTFAEQSTTGSICVTDRVNQPFIFVLFFGWIDPREFNRTVVYGNPAAEFRDVLSFGRFTFGLDRCSEKPVDAYVLTPDEVSRLKGNLFTMEHFERYVVAVRKEQSDALSSHKRSQ